MMSLTVSETRQLIIFYANISIYGVALVLNIGLLILILAKTPQMISTYSITLISTTIFDLLTSLCEPMVMNRWGTVDSSVLYVFHGPCSYFGSTVCFSLFTIADYGMFGIFPSLALSFAYRSRQLTARTWTKWDVIIWSIPIHLGCLLIIPAYFYARRDPNGMATFLLANNYTIIDINSQTISGIQPFPNVGLIYVFFWLCANTVSIPLILYYRRRIYTILHAKRGSMSRNTVNMHEKLTKALSLQASLPCIFSILVIDCVCRNLGVYTFEFSEEGTFLLIGIMPLLNPLITMYFVSPYQKAITGMLRYRRKSSLFVSPQQVTNIAWSPASITTKMDPIQM